MWLIKNFPLPPSVNNSLASVVINRSVRQIKTSAGRAFDAKVQEYILKNKHHLDMIAAEIKVSMDLGYQLKIMCYYCFNKSDLWTKDKRVKRLDTNNRIKATLDGVSKAIGIDDRHFFAEEHEKIETDELTPHVMIAIGTHRPTLKKNLWISQDSKDLIKLNS